jgi:uncharacterized protein
MDQQPAQSFRNKRKIVNDPVHGFINIPSELVFDLVEHPWFQRLRRIKQLGLTHYVYPGATHTRFQHALGAVYLMAQAISVIRSKGFEITEEEAEAVTIAILLHDIGHGPFSHALEASIVEKIRHELLSLVIMDRLNRYFSGRLDMAIDIFRQRYKKKFLHQLVSSQLDMDRLDYLKRDSFYTGVTEGVIGSDRIIKMLNVVDDELVIEAKGIYSIEKFLIARRLMYWQVYLHKSVLSAENLLVMLLKRAKELAARGEKLFCSPSLEYFLYQKFPIELPGQSFDQPLWEEVIRHFTLLDDSDIISASKVWMDHPDKVLAKLCSNFNNRHLYHVQLQNHPFEKPQIDALRGNVMELYGIDDQEAGYFVISESITSNTYDISDEHIRILYHDGETKDISEASDMLNPSILSQVTTKYFLCYPKGLTGKG